MHIEAPLTLRRAGLPRGRLLSPRQRQLGQSAPLLRQAPPRARHLLHGRGHSDPKVRSRLEAQGNGDKTVNNSRVHHLDMHLRIVGVYKKKITLVGGRREPVRT